MAEDTAVAELETAPEVVEEQPVAELEAPTPPETTDDPAPETEEPVAPETPKSFDDLTDEELQENERFKALTEARIAADVSSKTESIRRTQESDTQKRLAAENQARADQFLKQGLNSGFQDILARVLASDDQTLKVEDLPRLNALIEGASNAALVSAQGMATQRQFAALNSIETPKDWKAPDDLAARYNQANGAGDVGAQSEVLTLIAHDMGRQTGIAEGRKLATAEAKKELDAAKANLAEERAKAERGPSPTSGAGGNASASKPIDAITDPDSTWEQKQAAFKALTGEEWRP